MVNNTYNVSSYEGQPPSDTGGSRIYIEGPLYPIDSVLEILDSGDDQTYLWTNKCIRDVGRLSLDMSEVTLLIKQAVTQGRYQKSEWCVQKPTGPWAACDGYQLYRNEWIDYAHKEMSIEYYIKFAIGKTGKILLLISCHTSQ